MRHYYVPTRRFKQQVGGIFLRTNTVIPAKRSLNPSRFFHLSPAKAPSIPRSLPIHVPSVMTVCNRIKRDFLDHHETYSTLQPLSGIEHVIIYLNGRLSLLAKAADGTLSEVETQLTPALKERYNIIKSISHSSVWLSFVLQSIIDGGERTTKHRTDLLQIKAHLQSLNDLSADPIADEKEAINEIITVIDKTIVAERLGQIKCLHAQYLQRSRSINNRYAEQATQLQLKGMHEIIGHWLMDKQLQLNNTRVIIVSAYGARSQLIEKQYFLDLYAKHGLKDAEKKSCHIICLGMLPDQMATVSQTHLIEYLKKHQMNIRIGDQLLGDPTAMNRDVLSSHAPEVLKTLCPYRFHKKAIPMESVSVGVEESGEVNQLNAPLC